MELSEIGPGPLLERVLDDTYPHWNDGLSRRAYSQWYLAQTRTAWGKDRLRRVGLLRGDEVLASAKLYLLDALIDGKPERVLGIGAVFTPTAHRGQGLAAELLNRLIDDGQARGCTWALLFSEIGADYYERFGFMPIPRSEVVVHVPRTRRGAPATMIRALEPGDLAELSTMAMTYAASRGFALDRTPALIEFNLIRKRARAGLGPAGLRQVEAFVTEEGGRAAAYIIISRGPEGVVLEEGGDRDPRGSRLGAMLEAYMERDPSQPDRTLRAWLPAGLHPPQLPFDEAKASAEVMMVRPLGTGPHADPARLADCVYWTSDVF